MNGLLNQKTVINMIICKEKTFQLVLVSMRMHCISNPLQCARTSRSPRLSVNIDNSMGWHPYFEYFVFFCLHTIHRILTVNFKEAKQHQNSENNIHGWPIMHRLLGLNYWWTHDDQWLTSPAEHLFWVTDVQNLPWVRRDLQTLILFKVV